jgi:hypothetical protein
MSKQIKKLTLNRETVTNLNVRSAVKTGVAAATGDASLCQTDRQSCMATLCGGNCNGGGGSVHTIV